MRPPITIPLITTLMLMLSVLAAPQAFAAGKVTGKGRILDGDTVAIGKKHIRLRGLDAPEREQLCKPLSGGTAACGRQAATVLKTLIADRPLVCQIVEEDSYGRQVGFCSVAARGKDPAWNLNREMVRLGWAVAYWTDDFTAEEKEAKAAKRGLWAMRFQPPEDWRKAHR
ncbi:thermonuclease family protein [Novispirillum itersonii]|uniref:thermonuclease family protein n=1 Tax=Novispirillum itersonii TaxID=189 RepID=UPI000368C5FE|nr:thermonuclease family protein [Novispirillum itersonii]